MKLSIFGSILFASSLANAGTVQLDGYKNEKTIIVSADIVTATGVVELRDRTASLIANISIDSLVKNHIDPVSFANAILQPGTNAIVASNGIYPSTIEVISLSVGQK